MLQIWSELKEHPPWISVVETTDTLGYTLGNLLLGRLDNKQYHTPFLVKCLFLEKSNAGTVACLVNDTLRWLFPDFDMRLAKLFVTDGAHYMLKGGSDLRTFYPDLVHCTCMAHGLHRICEKTREIFKDVNTLISTCKKVFLKAPLHHTLYKESYPDLPFPPEPILVQ